MKIPSGVKANSGNELSVCIYDYQFNIRELKAFCLLVFANIICNPQIIVYNKKPQSV